MRATEEYVAIFEDGTRIIRDNNAPHCQNVVFFTAWLFNQKPMESRGMLRDIEVHKIER